MKKLIVLLISLSMIACATTEQVKEPPKLVEDVITNAFLVMMRNVASNGPLAEKNKPPVNEDWIFISDFQDVIYYLNAKDLIINDKKNSVVFTLLNDNRKYKDWIIKEFNAQNNKRFIEAFPEFVSYRVILDCTKIKSTVQWKEIRDNQLKITKKTYGNLTDYQPLVKNSVNESICFTLDMMDK